MPVSRCKHAAALHWLADKLYVSAWFIIKFYTIEAKRTGSIVILSLKQQQKSEFSFFFKTKGKKRKGSIVNYRSFAITTLDS